MIPKVSAALSRLLKPLKEVSGVGKLNKFSKTSKDPESGGNLPYEKLTKEEKPQEETKQDAPKQFEAFKPDKPEKNSEKAPAPIEPLPQSLLPLEDKEKQKPGIPFQAGLTEVILELKSETHKNIKTASTGNQYEQNGGPRANKGAMLDKKVG